MIVPHDARVAVEIVRPGPQNRLSTMGLVNVQLIFTLALSVATAYRSMLNPELLLTFPC